MLLGPEVDLIMREFGRCYMVSLCISFQRTDQCFPLSIHPHLLGVPDLLRGLLSEKTFDPCFVLCEWSKDESSISANTVSPWRYDEYSNQKDLQMLAMLAVLLLSVDALAPQRGMCGYVDILTHLAYALVQYNDPICQWFLRRLLPPSA